MGLNPGWEVSLTTLGLFLTHKMGTTIQGCAGDRCSLRKTKSSPSQKGPMDELLVLRAIIFDL